MDFANVFTAAIIWFCSLVFAAIALWAFKSRAPMSFWSGCEVKPEDIADIPAYNRAMGVMWLLFTVCWLATGLVTLLSIIWGVALLLFLCGPGIIALIMAYKQIYNKYKS